MTTLAELLQETDPLRHEPETWSDQKASRRQAVLAAAAGGHPARTPAVSRVAPRAAIALAVAAMFLAVAFVGSHLWQPPRAVQAAVRFEVRLAEENPAPGLRAAKLEGSDRSVYLHEEVIVSNADISSAKAAQNAAGQYYVGIEFTAAGAQKMRAATAGHIGRLMAILIDDRVVMAPILRSLIIGSAQISGTFTKDQAEKLAAGIMPPG